jgi:perosamine synthetase
MRGFLTRLPPGGERVTVSQCRDAFRVTNPSSSLRAGLLASIGASRLSLHASGREALRVAFGHLATLRGRDEIWVPGYTCFSIPAAAVAAGLRVRLVEIGLDGRIDPNALARMPLERAAALVVSNLFGVPEPVAALRELLHSRGVALVDDAAQSLGARSAEGPVGGRGDVGALSFGRGKPLSALGGGALAWADSDGPADSPAPDGAPRPLMAIVRAAAFNVARLPAVFRWLSAIPALAIGETRYDPNFERGGIDGASLCLAAAVLPEFEIGNRNRARRAISLAARISAETDFSPLIASEGDEAVYPRLGVLAQTAAKRDEALRVLTSVGVTKMYPSALGAIDALRPRLADEPNTPVARDFAARLLTLPTGAALVGGRLDFALRTLRRLS